MQIDAALVISLSVTGRPSVTAALVGCSGGVLRVEDGEVQGDDAVATGSGPADDGVCGSAVVGGVGLPVPSIATAGGDGLHALGGNAGPHIDGDAGRCAGASVSVSGNGVGGGTGGRHGDGIGIRTCGPNIAVGAVCGERGAFIEMDETIAGNGYIRDRLDGEVQRIDLRAAVGIGVAVQVGAALGVGLPVAGSPGVAATLTSSGNGVLYVVDGEVQGDDTVTAGGSPARNGECRGAGALRVGGAVPGETFARSDGLHALCGYARPHNNCDVRRLAGAPVGRACDGVDHCRCGGDCDGVGVFPC